MTAAPHSPSKDWSAFFCVCAGSIDHRPPVAVWERLPAARHSAAHHHSKSSLPATPQQGPSVLLHSHACAFLVQMRSTCEKIEDGVYRETAVNSLLKELAFRVSFSNSLNSTTISVLKKSTRCVEHRRVFPLNKKEQVLSVWMNKV